MGERPTEHPHIHNTVPREDEPRFVLLGRDPHAYQAVDVWASLREQAIIDGIYPESDRAKVAEAREQAAIMKAYCEEHLPPAPAPMKRRRPK